MSKEQIEEMRKDIFAAFGGYAKWEEDWQSLAEALYNAGYRKQEWISVYERLPETETPVIIFTKKGTYYVGYYYKGAVNPVFTGFYSNGCKRDATHWMHLPEPPKMKGGVQE